MLKTESQGTSYAQRAPLSVAAVALALWLAACSPELPSQTGPSGAETANAPHSGPSNDIAVYKGGTVTRDEYEGMLLRRGLKDDPGHRLEHAQKVAVTEAMASVALEKGAEERLSYQVSLRILYGETLQEALKRHVLAQIALTDADIDRAVEEQRDRFQRPRRVRLKNIFKRFPREGGPAKIAETRAQMERIEKELAAGADFAELATRESDSQTRLQGGRLGLVDPGTLDPAIGKIAMNLRPGETSPSIETPMGLTILRCDEVVEASVLDEETIRKTVEQRLRSVRLPQRWSRLGEELLQGVRFDITELQEPGGDSAPAIELPDGDALDAEEVAEFLRQGGEPRPPSEVPRDKMEEFLRQLALTQRAAARARELGLDEVPDTKAKLVWGRRVTLAGEEIRARIQERFEPVSVADARAHFETHRKGFQLPKQYRLGVIVINAPRENIRAAYARAEALGDEIRTGRVSFEEAARELSSHPSAGQGGDLGWLDPWQVTKFGPIVSKVVPTLEPGQISDVLQQAAPATGGSTLWIVRLMAIRPSRPMSFEEAVAQGLIPDLEKQRWNTLLDEVWQEILEELEVRMASEVLPE